MKNTMFITVGFGMLLCWLPLSAFGSGPGDHVSKSSSPSYERIARHAMGRADLAERMGLCFQDQASNLRKMATELLQAKTAMQKQRYRDAVKAAHEALTNCLDLYSKKCTKKCSPLPPATISASASESAPRKIKGTVRAKIIAVDNGSIQDNTTGAGTKAMRLELDRGIKSKNLSIDDCYSKAQKKDPDLAGMAAYRLVFGPDGHVSKSQLLSTTLANLSLARCALTPLGALRLSPKIISNKATAIVRLVFSTTP